MDHTFFLPRSIAVVGASRDRQKIGAQILGNIRENFRGEVYPVNPKARRIGGLRCYKDIASLPDGVEMAVIVVPAPFVLEVVEACGRKGILHIVVISAGFGEAGKEGQQRERALKGLCDTYGLTLLGPNCLGFLYPAAGLNVSFGPELPREGSVALFSQSGAMAVALMDWAHQTSIGFSAVVSMGNKAMMDETMLLEWAAQDPFTEVIVLYLESIEYGTAFMEAAARIAAQKPIILLKAGSTDLGSHAIASHTGKIAGDAKVFASYCRSRGILLVDHIEELFDVAELFARHRHVQGPRVGVLTNAGGPGVLTTDVLATSGLTLASLSPGLKKRLRQQLSPAASFQNPVDILGDATSKEYEWALTTLCASGEVDMIIVLLTPQTITDVQDIAQQIVRIQRRYLHIPIVASFIGGHRVEEGITLLEESSMVHLEFPHRAVLALKRLWEYAQFSCEVVSVPRAHLPKVLGGRGVLPIVDVQRIMKELEFPLMPFRMITHLREVEQLPKSLYPVAVKVDNAHVLHKSDEGGVVLSLSSPSVVERTVRDMQRRLHVPYVLAEKMCLEDAVWVFVGWKRSPYGDVLVIGMGGIYAELFPDHLLIPAPFSKGSIQKVLRTHPLWQMLSGYRGQSHYDTQSFVRFLLRMSHWFTVYRDVVAIDVNPLFVLQKGVQPIDVKIMME